MTKYLVLIINIESILLVYCALVYMPNKDKELKSLILREQAIHIEYLRLKTAMALGGIDDFIETTPGNVEVKMIK